MPITRSGKQSEAEHEGIKLTPEIDNSAIKQAMKTTEIRL